MRRGLPIVLVLICAVLAAQIVPSSQGVYRHPIGMDRGRIYTNVHQGPDSLHRPWAGSGIYQKNIELGRGSGSSSRSSFQRDRDATLDVYHREEERARWIRRQEQQTAEKEAQVRANKAQIELDRRQAELARKAREDAQQAELRRRAEEQEHRQHLRQIEKELSYERTMRSLTACQAVMADGLPCPRKANPGLDFCYLHVDWKGAVRCDLSSQKGEDEVVSRPQVQEVAAPSGERVTQDERVAVPSSTVQNPTAEKVCRRSAVRTEADVDPITTFKLVVLIGGFILAAIVLVGFFVLQAIRLAKKSPFDA